MRHILTITTPAAVRALVTRDRVKAELGIVGAGSDSLIDDKILDASSAVETYCNRVFASEVVSETFWPALQYAALGPPGFSPLEGALTPTEQSLALSRFPVSAIASVTVDDVVLDPTEYTLDADPGLLYRQTLDRLQISWWSYQSIVVDYTAGYLLPGESGRNLPRDIEAAVLSVVKAGWFARRRDPAVRQEAVPGVYEAQYWSGTIAMGDGALPPDAEGMLARYVQAATGA